MNRTQYKGSITVEAIVMLGLIAALTPILYKHVAERREDIENINKANTLLLLKNAAGEYIEANKEVLSVGTIVIEPADIGIDISGYQIGIRKDSSGKVSAMIASSGGGNDIQAAKIASLLGVSAGIYSAQDTSKAWGINGIWAENVSSYGFTSLPTGVPVVTTAYDKDISSGLNEEQLKEVLESSSFSKLSVDEICLQGKCIADWADTSYEAIETIINCNNGDNKACKKAFQKGTNTSCAAIAATYKENEGVAQTGYYTLAASETSFLYNQPCVFTNGSVTSNANIIAQCNADSSSISCRYGWNNNINRSCAGVIASHTSAATGWYNITTSSGATSTPCVFVGSRVATNAEVISQCNSAGGSSVQCRYGWNNNINRSCERIIASNTSAASGWYQITTSSSSGSQPCYFVGSRVATASETVSQCNTATTSNAMSSNIACRYGYVRGYNTDCTKVLNNYSSGYGKVNSISASSGGNRQCCSCYVKCAALGTITDGECKDFNGKGWVRSTRYMNYWDSQTFCSSIGMEVKTTAQLQADGLWNTGTNPFSPTNWYWTSNGCGENSGFGIVVWLGNTKAGCTIRDWANHRNWLGGGVSYGLCGQKAAKIVS